MKIKVITILTIILLFCLCTVIYKFQSVNAETATESEQLVQDLTQANSFKTAGVKIVKNDDNFKIDRKAAIGKAKGYFGSNADSSAKIMAAKVTFSDNFSSSNNLKNRAAWIVSFKGIKIYGNGKASNSSVVGCNTEMNVVVDANTGDEIEMFCFR